MEGWATVALVAAVITTGLVAGLFAVFAHAVLPGLARADDRTFVEAVQGINAAILNGWFAASFGGAPLATTAAVLLHLGARPLPWIVAGLVLHAAVLVVTFRVNVPLNDALAATGTDDPATARKSFETAWVRWNAVRAVASTAAFGCLVAALVTR